MEENEVEGDEVLDSSRVVVMKIVLVGSDSITVVVNTTVFVAGVEGSIEAITVLVSVIVAIEDVAADPPSTATTEYGERICFDFCLLLSPEFRGKACVNTTFEDSKIMSKKNFRSIVCNNSLYYNECDTSSDCCDLQRRTKHKQEL